MDFLHWFTDPITKHYADFSGRATRQEFWMYILIYIIAFVVLNMISETIAMLLALGLLVPNIAITARRLHDIGKSGWWQLIALIPIIGTIILIVWCAKETGKEANEYGPATVVAAAPAAPTPMAAGNMVEGHSELTNPPQE